jgi:hypothetical protein
MPDHMNEKCAEAFALRRAYPNDLGGMYVEEELQHEAPKIVTRRRPAGADDDAFAEYDPADTPGKGAAAADGDRGAADGAPGDDDRKRSLAKIHAIFREYGLGGRDQEVIRRAIVTGLLTPEKAEFPPEYIPLSKLTPQATAAVASALELWVDGQPKDEDIGAKLTFYGTRVTEGVQRSQAAAKAAAEPQS